MLQLYVFAWIIPITCATLIEPSHMAWPTIWSCLQYTVLPGRMMPQDQYIDSSSNPYWTRPFPMCNIEFRFIHSPPDNHTPVCAHALVSPFSCADFSLLCSPHGTSSLSACIPCDQFTFCMDSLLLSFSPFSLPSLYEFWIAIYMYQSWLCPLYSTASLGETLGKTPSPSTPFPFGSSTLQPHSNTTKLPPVWPKYYLKLRIKYILVVLVMHIQECGQHMYWYMLLFM